jgi:hypothetical protein
VRFLGQRAEALWYEYVLNLHRLHVDDPHNLPRPPETSSYFVEWGGSGRKDREEREEKEAEGHGRHKPPTPNIYKQKFNAFYGKSLAESVERANPRVTTETLFPVLLTTVIVAVGWVAVFWRGLDKLESPRSQLEMIEFAFIGAYVFVIQMLIRRFFQSDLRASAYAHAIVRLITAAMLVPVIHQLLFRGKATVWEPLVAFTVGAFPLVGLQAIVQVAARPLRVAVPSLRPTYPLSQLDGLNVWYEARLLEEGIEDMQNLATANIVDVVLHTKAPVGRLVEWIDQAKLWIHLPPMPDGWVGQRVAAHRQRRADRCPNSARVRRHPREALRSAGLTTATGLVQAIPLDDEGHARTDRAKKLVEYLQRETCVDASAIETVAFVLSEDKALNPVWSWRCGAPEIACRSGFVHGPAERAAEAAAADGPRSPLTAQAATGPSGVPSST